MCIHFSPRVLLSVNFSSSPLLLFSSSPLLLFFPSSHRYCGHLDSSQRFLKDALRLRQALALAANTATNATAEEAAANTAAAAAGGARSAREAREARDEKKVQKAVIEGKGTGVGTGTVTVMEDEAANSPDIASSLHELGVLHIRRCEWETASVLLQRSLRMKRTLQHGQHSDFTRQGRFSEEAATLHQLAVVAMSCKPRRLEEAEQLLRQALESSRGPFMVRCVYVYVYVHVYMYVSRVLLLVVSVGALKQLTITLTKRTAHMPTHMANT